MSGSRFFQTVAEGGAQIVSSLEGGKFAAAIVRYPTGDRGVLKVRPFANDLYRGIPKEGMPRREVASYLVDRHVLDFGVVPETILTTWEGREASVQKFVFGAVHPRKVVPGLFDKTREDWRLLLARFFRRVSFDDLMKIAILDLVINSVDRHGKNILVAQKDHRIWAIDNGLTFGRFFKNYRSVIHKYAFQARFELPEWAVKRLQRIERYHLDVLDGYVPKECINDTWLRIQFILEHKDRLAFRRMSAGADPLTRAFPHYAEWFYRRMHKEELLGSVLDRFG